MKKLIGVLCAVCVLLFADQVLAQDLDLTWQFDGTNRPATGFKVYEKVGTTYTELTDFKNGTIRTGTISRAFSTGTHVFVMTAYDADGQSNYSNEYPVSLLGEWDEVIILNITVRVPPVNP